MPTLKLDDAIMHGRDFARHERLCGALVSINAPNCERFLAKHILKDNSRTDNAASMVGARLTSLTGRQPSSGGQTLPAKPDDRRTQARHTFCSDFAERSETDGLDGVGQAKPVQGVFR